MQAYRDSGYTFDIVLLDNGLPDLPGTLVASAMACLPVSPLVILVSGHSFEAVSGELEPGSVCEVLLKPVHPTRIASAITAILAQRE